MHTSTSIQGAAPTKGIVSLVTSASGLLSRIPLSIPQLALRIALAVPFYRSGLTKWDGWFHLSDSAVYLFTQEFQLHLFGNSIPYPAPNVVALLSGIAEITLPVLLVLGLATRFAALGLLFMTLIIQLTIPDGWANFHLPWAAMALALVVHGPGRLSLDHLLAKRG
ncbi:MAG: DoxX family protein [Steroidobacteraceae bacterium]